MGRRTNAIAILVFALFVAATRTQADDTRFTRLTGNDVRAKVIGKVVTDGAHWSDHFDKGGALISFSQGRKSAGKWEIRGDELCITEKADAGATCYQVWVSGDEVSLRLDGAESTVSGYLRAP